MKISNGKLIDNITAKASRTVGFLRRNPYNCTKEVREATYCSIVRPTLDYASSVWDPYRTTDINRVEQVQRRAARFVHCNYWDRTPGCVSRMVRELGWPPLVDRRREHRLTMLYKIQRGLVDINPGPILRTNDRRTRGGNRIYQPAAPQPVYKYSFYPRTIQEWNMLPPTTTDCPTLEEFTAAIRATDAAVFVAP